MNRHINIYRIHLEPHESFVFWHDGDKVTPAASLKSPYPGDVFRIWTPGGWVTNPNFKAVDRVFVSNNGVYIKDIERYIIENAFEMSKVLVKDKSFDEYSIFVGQKPFDDRLIQIGACGLRGYADIRDLEIENKVNRRLKLSVFW